MNEWERERHWERENSYKCSWVFHFPSRSLTVFSTLLIHGNENVFFVCASSLTHWTAREKSAMHFLIARDFIHIIIIWERRRKSQALISIHIEHWQRRQKKKRMSLVCLCFSWMNFLKTYLKHYSRVEKYVYGTFLCSIEKMNENCLAIWISISCVHFFIILLSENRP